MDVCCPKCSTIYELDPTQVKSALVTLKCSQCQHVFRFETRSTSNIQENQKRWMIRDRESGDVLYVNNFELVHQWIMERKISKTDQISRTGKKWTALEDIGEFGPVFQVVDSISSIAGLTSPAAKTEAPPSAESQLPPSPKAAKPAEVEERKRVPTTIQFGGESTEEVTKRARPPEVAPTPPAPKPKVEQPSPKLTPEPVTQDWHFGENGEDNVGTEIAAPPPKSGRGSGIFLFLVVAGLVGGAAYIYQFERDMFNSVVQGSTKAKIVSLSADAGSSETVDAGKVAVVEDGPKAHQLVRGAVEAAQTEKSRGESQLWDGIIRATRPGFDQALGVATEEAEHWAEGGGVKLFLADAKKALERGRARSALKKYQEVLALEPKNIEAVTGLGWTYLEMSRYEDASRQFERAIDINHKFGDAYIGLGSSERQRGNLKEAYDAYDLYLGRLPKGPKASIARYQLEQLRQQLGM